MLIVHEKERRMIWRRIILAVGLAWAASTAHAGSVGVFSETSGDVKFLRGDSYFAAVPGVEVEAQDLVETADDGSAQLDMKDGTLLRIGPGSHLSLSEYRLDDGGNVLSAGIEVVSGWLRFAVAKLHADADYRIETSTMTIGIRGTEGVVEAKDTEGSLYLEEGAVDVHSADAAPGAPSAAHVRGGGYIERMRGRAFMPAAVVPAAFRERMPPVFRERMQRRVHLLRRRGVPPREIRRIRADEVRQYLERHPYMRHNLQRQMRARYLNRPDPSRLRQNPNGRKRWVNRRDPR